MKTDLDPPPFAQSVDDVLTALQSKREGLSSSESSERLAKDGRNELPAAQKESLLKRFFKHFHDLLIYILLVAAVITAALGHWIDTWVILAVVVINAAIGFIQEGKAQKALEGIRNMLSPFAQARRNGEWKEIDARDLVAGDIVRLRSGDRVPADVRLFDVNNLRIEESALTGESEPTVKAIDPVAAEAGVGDRRSMAFSGSIVTGGRGLGVVTATGADTEIGRINTMISEVETLATPLMRQMASFSKILSVVIIGLSVAMFVIGWVFHRDVYSISDLFFAAIGMAVAAIPEGLPAIMSITLAIGVQTLARRKAITRKLNSVETLGSITVICSDKTGTLTRNEMTVREVVTVNREYSVSGIGYQPEGSVTLYGKAVSLKDDSTLTRLVEVMALCNDSSLSEEGGQWKLLGEPTEGALISLAKKLEFTGDGSQRAAVVPFESDNKFMATLEEINGREGKFIFLKGAPDRLLDRSSHQLSSEAGEQSLDRAYWEGQIDALSRQGLRVLAAAVKPVGAEKSDLNLDDFDDGMLFLGLVGIVDPPRPEAIESIRICREAGIAVKMITGDHAGTALAIAREMGITDCNKVITGAELEVASDSELEGIAQEYAVFARTSPEHKLRLVKALQAQGEVVAMTGDGVNDAPALKRADVGVAMGIKGTEATKEAADVVLADDNFATIERAVEEGRTIYDNLRKAILFILPTNGAQAFVLLVAILLGMTLPLTPVQILWVNMVTAVTLALALAFEPAEPGLMKRPPRDARASIIGLGTLWRVFFVSLLIGGATIWSFQNALAAGVSEAAARTLAVNVLVGGQVFYLFNSRFIQASSLGVERFFTNRYVWFAVGVMALLQFAFVYAPPLQSAFGTEGLTLFDWLKPVAVGVAVFFLVEAEKAIINKFRKRPKAL
jgi:magnesium-transporting ATPase (P-type)